MKKIKGYVINLNNRPERLQEFYQQPEALNFVRLPAVDKQVLSQINPDFVFNTRFFLEKVGRPITLGEIGCTLSHIQCWHNIANDPELDDQDFALVAEDDVIFRPHFTQKLNAVLSHVMPQQAEIALLLLQKTGLYSEKWNTIPDSPEHSTTISLVKPTTGADCSNDGSVLYAIRKSYAKTLVKFTASNKPFWLADQFSWFIDISKIRMLLPTIAYVSDAVSDLDQDRERAKESVK